MKVRMLVPLALVLLLAAAWFAAGKMHPYAYWIGRTTTAELQSLATDGWRLEPLAVTPDVTLAGLVRPPRQADARWILFVPGNAPALLAGFRPVLDGLRGDDDVGLALWAYRGFDASTGTPCPGSLADDLLRQWRHLMTLGARPERTEIWGYSLGSVLAVQLAARLAAAGERPARLVLAAAGERIAIMPYGAFGRFRGSDVYDVAGALAQVDCATVIAHGAADAALPIDGARRLAAALGPRATLHELPGKGHFDLWDAVRRVAW
ncbi:MAG: alpha/beta hydrolase [Planctomycetes bacterium]|nr:alpha/beta hydrolase [Planctomycetota bacterium]